MSSGSSDLNDLTDALQRGLNDEVNVIVLIDRYYYCFLTDENTANKEVTQAVWHQNLYFCPHSKLSLWS